MLLWLIDLIAGLCLVAQFALAAYYFWLIWWLANLPEAAPEPPALADVNLPHVLVQLPVYIEPLVVERALASAGGRDWPGDRLTIQLLDDSTDLTCDFGVHAVARL